ncbi:VOC family protein [Mycobacterium sp.]|uniref:VOC family protein n=1 Tax=Mycobacterium sp. TaxID=1785 RepID=UPI0025D65A81|nr:VOC family protein [Mycobacterium sp.]
MSLSFGSPVQTAWVTRDLDSTEKALTGLLGVKKWVRLPDVHFAPDACSYRDAPADFVAGISLSYLGDMQLELIQPVRGANIYSDFLQGSGPGLHHICVEAETLEDFDAALAAAAAQGATVPQQGTMPGGLRFAYLSAPQYGVPFVEIAHFSAEMRQFFDYIKHEQEEEWRHVN